MFLLTVSTLH